MAKRRLTDRTLKTLKPAAPGKRYDIMDDVVPGFGVRVSDKGKVTFILVARYPGSRINPKTGHPNPTRRELGEYGAMTLEDARQKARDWHELIRRGIDPKGEEDRQRQATAARRQATFGVAIEDYLARHLKGKRKAKDAEREIRAELIPVWKDKPLTEITRGDVVTLIEAIADRPAPYQAHNVFGHGRTFFNWAINRGTYPGLEASPFDRLKPGQLIGAKRPRTRVLNDDELRALWRASGRLGYPFGTMFRLLLITGQRKTEVAAARWCEFHPDLVRLIRDRKADDAPIEWHRVDNSIKLWTVGAERFKSDAPHLVPLSNEACAILEALPHFGGGDHLFSTTNGEKPVAGFSKAKARLDRHIGWILKAMARMRRHDPKPVKLEPFVNHDMRRSMRTRLSSLRVPDEVAEMVIGHGRKGLQRVYDQHRYVDEMREALELWAGRLRDITRPAPANLVLLKTA